MIEIGEKVLTVRKFSIINSATEEHLVVPAGTIGTVVDHAFVEDDEGMEAMMLAVALDELIPGQIVLLKKDHVSKAWVN